MVIEARKIIIFRCSLLSRLQIPCRELFLSLTSALAGWLGQKARPLLSAARAAQGFHPGGESLSGLKLCNSGHCIISDIR